MTGRLAVVIEADGGSRGNPGKAGFGAVVRESTTGEVLAERLGALGVATNNVAEYSGLIAGLQAAAELGATEVEVLMDSKLVVEQMSGRWQIKNAGLRPLAAQAAALVRQFDSTRFSWIPRERNKHADALANAAMDGRTDPPTRLAVGTESATRPAAGTRLGPVAEPAEARTVRTGWEPRTGIGTRLILVRHGQTRLTAERRYSGRGDVPLSGVGEVQARATAERIAAMVQGSPVAAVLSSPLSRCKETAEQIAVRTGTPVSIDPDLIECDFGRWEGHTYAEVRERWPAELEQWLGSTAAAPGGGESFDAVAQRVNRVVARLRDQYQESIVVLVSHVTPIKLILRSALDAGPSFLYRMHLDPAGISVLDSWPDGGVSVRAVNDTAHLNR